MTKFVRRHFILIAITALLRRFLFFFLLQWYYFLSNLIEVDRYLLSLRNNITY